MPLSLAAQAATFAPNPGNNIADIRALIVSLGVACDPNMASIQAAIAIIQGM